MMGPSVAPDGTVAVILTSEFTVKLPAPTVKLLNLTSLAPVNPVPLIVTEVPTGPDVGEKPVIEVVGVEPEPQLTDPEPGLPFLSVWTLWFASSNWKLTLVGVPPFLAPFNVT